MSDNQLTALPAGLSKCGKLVFFNLSFTQAQGLATEVPPGASPFSVTAPAGPPLTPGTFVEAEKLMRVEMTPADLRVYQMPPDRAAREIRAEVEAEHGQHRQEGVPQAVPDDALEIPGRARRAADDVDEDDDHRRNGVRRRVGHVHLEPVDGQQPPLALGDRLGVQPDQDGEQRDERQRPLGILETNNDITERKRQAEEIRDAFARHGVRYLFIGKSGAILLGFADTTQDADVFEGGSTGDRMAGVRVPVREFDCLLGDQFKEPATYRVSWKGAGFRSSELVFRVLPKQSR